MRHAWIWLVGLMLMAAFAIPVTASGPHGSERPNYTIRYDFGNASPTLSDAFGSCPSGTAYLSQATAWVGDIYSCPAYDSVIGACAFLVSPIDGSSVRWNSDGAPYHKVFTTTQETSGISELHITCGTEVAGGGGALDDLIVDGAVDLTCPVDTVIIPAVTGLYHIESTSGCLAGETIEIADVGLAGLDAILLTIVNDSGVDLVVDGTTNNTTVTLESGSTKVPDDTTFVVEQVSGSGAIHIIGTGDTSTVTSVLKGRTPILNMTASSTTTAAISDVLGTLFICQTTCTLDLPDVSGLDTGLSFCARTGSVATVLTINPANSDFISLDGVLMSAGEAILSNGSTANENVCLTMTGDPVWSTEADSSDFVQETP